MEPLEMNVGKDTQVVNAISFNSILKPVVNGVKTVY